MVVSIEIETITFWQTWSPNYDGIITNLLTKESESLLWPIIKFTMQE